MPHGGPESYDGVGFDWLAQFLANEGYLVLQPNFRGSGGFGASFAQAGYGEWGRKMQDDVTDGAKALISMGWADPEPHLHRRLELWRLCRARRRRADAGPLQMRRRHRRRLRPQDDARPREARERPRLARLCLLDKA